MRLPRVFTVCLVTLFLFSCKAKNEKVSRDEAIDISHKIDSTIDKRQPGYIDGLLDENVFAKRVAKVLNSKNTRALLKGMRQALDRFRLGDKIMESIGPDGRYELVKIYEKDNEQHLLYRLFSDEGLNYHDIVLCKRNNKIGIADFYIYLSGENLSETLAGLFNAFDKNLSGNDSEADVVLQRINQIRRYAEEKEYEKAFNYYKELPEALQKQRSLQIAYLMICKEYDDSKYLEGLLNFQSLYPNDPNIDLLMMDAYILNKEIPKAMASLDKLDRFIDSDPFLDYFRALISNIDNKSEDARKYLERLYKNYPEFDSGILELIANYIQANMDEKANSLIKVYEQNEKFDQQSLKLYLYTQPQFQKN